MSNATSTVHRISDLEKDMSQLANVIERHYVTVEKLTEVSSAISQLLAVQGNRLDFQEKVADQLQDLVEKRRMETESYVKEIYSRIEGVETDIETKMSDQQTSIINEIQKLSSESQKQHTDMSNRMNNFEKWIWVAIGGGGVIMFLLQSVDIIKTIFS